MIEERGAPIEAHLDSLKELRKAYLSHYRFLEGNASEEYLSSILEDVHQLEVEIMEVRKQLPPPMSQRQLRALEEIPKAWAEVTGKKIGDEFLWERVDKAREEALCEAADKTLQEYADIAAGRDLESTAKRFEEAREEHGTPLWKVELHHSANGDKRFEGALEDDTVANIYGTVETPKMVIEAAPRRTGRTFRSWLCNYFK